MFQKYPPTLLRFSTTKGWELDMQTEGPPEGIRAFDHQILEVGWQNCEKFHRDTPVLWILEPEGIEVELREIRRHSGSPQSVGRSRQQDYRVLLKAQELRGSIGEQREAPGDPETYQPGWEVGGDLSGGSALKHRQIAESHQFLAPCPAHRTVSIHLSKYLRSVVNWIKLHV